MKKFFNKKSDYRGGNKFGSDARQTLHPATCSACGTACEVPFKPNGKKPVFCRDCFRKEEGGSFEKPAYRSTPRASTGGDDVAKQLKLLNTKMDRILEALEAAGDEGEI